MNLIYKVTNVLNNKVYIGQTTTSLEKRKKEHLSKQDNTYFHNALQKYGKECFIWEIIEQDIEISELNAREQYWIQYYNSNNHDNGYNLSAGGENGDALTIWRQQHPELVKEMAQKGNLAMKQKLINNPELEEKRKTNALIGIKKYSQEHQEEQRQHGMQIYLTHKEQQDAQMQQFHEQQSKRTLCIETGIIYPSVSEAHRQTGISQGNISAVCNGHRKTAGGYHWKYLDNNK